MGHDLGPSEGTRPFVQGLCREEGEMNWDSVGDDFAGAGPLHQECSPLTLLISFSLMPPCHCYPPHSASSLLCYSFGLCVCVFLWRAEVPFMSSSAPSCFLRQGLSLNLPIQPGWLATRSQGPAYLCFLGAGIMGSAVFTEGVQTQIPALVCKLPTDRADAPAPSVLILK